MNLPSNILNVFNHSLYLCSNKNAQEYNRQGLLLDQFNFEYEFISSTDYYKNGFFNKTLLDVLENHEKIIDIVKPILGSERRKTYSPFLPICPDTGQVFQVKINEVNQNSKKIFYTNP